VNEISKQLVWPDISEPGETYYRAGPLAQERIRERVRERSFKRKTVVPLPSEDLETDMADATRWDCEE
jgi:hypothetical protein